jgi:hypothetical protein
MNLIMSILELNRALITTHRIVITRVVKVRILILVTAFLLVNTGPVGAMESAHPIQEWEPLLWGGHIIKADIQDPPSDSDEFRKLFISIESIIRINKSSDRSTPLSDTLERTRLAGLSPAKIAPARFDFPKALARRPYRLLELRKIPPLYVSPRIPGEGEWEWSAMPKIDSEWPVIYRTTYRPSVKYPNAIAHMVLFDMRALVMRLYLGSGEPGASQAASRIEPDKVPRLVAITNAMWKQKHSRGAGAIYRGNLVSEMSPGMATLVIYKDNSVDIVEWDEDQDISKILDARQLRHLIVKDGQVVKTIRKGGVRQDAEIGLGFLLVEDDQMTYGFGGSMYGYGYGYSQPSGPISTRYLGDEWFIATRSAFGVRPDGNLVFAIGHHISTKDLAKALVLAGCVRAIHGDANPHNVVGNFYYRDDSGRIIDKRKLSPDQKDHTLNRYVESSYTSDFFAFFENDPTLTQFQAKKD